MAKKILVIDDDALVLKTLTNLLSRSGYEVETSKSTEEAYSKVKNTSFDLVISDIRMPGEDGISFIRRIKSEILTKEGVEIPFLFITGYASEDAPIEALKMGAKDYILKPFDLDELMKSVKKHLD